MAHSMGNRALIGALRQLPWEYFPKISQVVFVAADAKVTDFIDLVKEFPSESQGAKVPMLTVYCSRDDKALRLSRFNCATRNEKNYERLGNKDTCEKYSSELNVHFVKLVDATGLDTGTLQHSYHCEVLVVLNQLKDIFGVV